MVCEKCDTFKQNQKSMKKFILFISLLFVGAVQAQTVNIPDANFKNALVNEPVWDNDCDGFIMTDVDTNDDGEIQVTEAQAVICLRVAEFNIQSMEGIQAFSNLQILNCNVNQITEIDVSENLALTALDCQSNQLSELDVTNNSNLDRLNCWNNSLTELDVSQNSNLRVLSCSINQLTSIDVSQNPLLWMFSCNINQIESLDVSQNSDLVSILCYDNQLTSLNIKNGNNISLGLFRAEENPDLLCIQVDDEVYANVNPDWIKDATTVYSEDCLLGTNDLNKIRVAVYPNPVRENLQIESLENIVSVQVYSMLGKLLSSESSSNEIDFSTYTNGVYFVNVETEKGSVVQKILKQ